MGDRLIFEYSLADYRGALRCHRQNDALWRLFHYMGVMFVLLGAYQLYRDQAQPLAWAAVLYGGLVVIYPQASVIWRSPLLFRLEHHLHGPITVDLYADRIRFRSGLREITLYQVYKVVSTGHLVLLYDTRRSYICLPKRVCADDAEFEQVIKLGKRLSAVR